MYRVYLNILHIMRTWQEACKVHKHGTHQVVEWGLPKDDNRLLGYHVLASNQLQQCSLSCNMARARGAWHVSYVA